MTHLSVSLDGLGLQRAAASGSRRAVGMAALFVTLLVVSASGCRPFANAGDPCDEVPCGSGLQCVEGICLVPVQLPPPPPPCLSADDCLVDGSSAGRVCDEGVCGWLDCVADVDCGNRVCEDGVCAEREDCITDGDCKDDGICVDSICRPPCSEDADCDGLLPACREGRCEQSCFNDIMCFGDLCQDGICVAPACTVDDDCGDNEACNGGRCEAFTPCSIDAECFDVDFICNDLGRCEELPVCTADSECAANELCRQDHCRVVDSCALTADCDEGDECVDGRCSAAPNCRFSDDCAANEVCANLNCIEPTPEEPAAVAVTTPHGTCRAGGEGACRLVLVEGETAQVTVGAFDANGEPVYAGNTYDVVDAGVIDVSADGGLTATAAGRTQLRINQGRASVHTALVVDVVSADAEVQLLVLTVNERTGAPIANAQVQVGAASAASNMDGRAVFILAPPPDAAGQRGLLVTAPNFRGVYVPNPPVQGALRVALRPASTSANASGARAAIRSSGDETGPVGYGLGLGSSESIEDATYARMMGDVFTSQIEIPVIGNTPLDVYGAVTLDAAIPLIQTPIVKDAAFVRANDGFATVTAFELRVEAAGGGALGGLLGQSADELALEIIRIADGADVLVAGRGERAAQALVADSNDIDGDGNTAELIPDYDAFPQIEITPTQRPTERVGFSFPPTVLDARADLFVIAGEHMPGIGFVPTGVTSIQSPSAGGQVRVRPPPAARAHATRALCVQAVYDDARESFAVWRGAGFEAQVGLAPLLDPPGDALVLDGVPVAGQRTLVVAQAFGATTMRVEAQTSVGAVDIIVPLAGAGDNIVLPEAFDGAAVALGRIEAARLPGTSALLATLSRFAVGQGPAPALRRSADAFAAQ